MNYDYTVYAESVSEWVRNLFAGAYEDPEQPVYTGLEAFVAKDIEMAKKVIARDDVIDAMFDDTKKEVIDLIQNKGTGAEVATDLLMVAKYFERIGDHATNIAEWVEFSITGIHKESKV